MSVQEYIDGNISVVGLGVMIRIVRQQVRQQCKQPESCVLRRLLACLAMCCLTGRVLNSRG